MNRRDVPIETPCSARWDRMEGDAQRRRCSACETDVHDLTALTERDARAFVAANSTACLRYRYDRRTGALVHATAPTGTAPAPTPRLGATSTGATSTGATSTGAGRLGRFVPRPVGLIAVLAAIGLASGPTAWAGGAVAPEIAWRLWDRIAAVGVWLGWVAPPEELVIEDFHVIMGIQLILEPPEATETGSAIHITPTPVEPDR